jgi:hypothetical protein
MRLPKGGANRNCSMTRIQIGGTGFQPVKSGILPDFARTTIIRTFRRLHAG